MLHPTTLLAPILAAISLYAAQKSCIAITNLRQYEERSERAAKHSDTAAHQLWKTRATQGSSAVAIGASLITSVAIFIQSSPTWRLVLPALNVLALAAGFQHNRAFWRAKAKVPFVQGFNEGIQKSADIRRLMVLLAVGWFVVGVVEWIWA